MSDNFRTGKIDAAELSQALKALAGASPGGLGELLDALITDLNASIAAAKDLKAELASVAPPSFRASENASMAAYGKMLESGRAFVAEAERRAGLSKEQLALEKEIAEVRKEAAASGVTLTDRQVKDLAQTRTAGDAARAQEGKAPKAIKASSDSRFDQDLQYVRDRTAALLAEQQMIGQSVAAQESRRLAIELEQQALADLREEARRKGETDLESIQLAPDQVAAIQDVADAYGQQAQALEKAQQAFADANDLARGFADDLTSGLLDGASAADALANALDNVADKLLDMALNALFEPGGGNFLSAILGAVAGGGAGVGSHAGGGGLGPLYDKGGYTGAGGRKTPAGVVHKGEVVWNQDDVRRAGGVSTVEAMRRGIRGYAAGGPVAVAPRLPSLAGMGRGGRGSGSVSLSIPISIDARGATPDAVELLGKRFDKLEKGLPRQVIQTIQQARLRNTKI